MDGWRNMALSELLARGRLAASSGPALLAHGRAPLDHAGLERQLDHVGEHLRRLGLGPGDPVAVVLPDGAEMAVLCLALACHSTCCPLNPDYRRAEYEFFLDDLKPRALVLRSGAASPARDVAAEFGIPVLEISGVGEGAAGTFELSGGDATGDDVVPRKARPDDVALVLHTSGTTSRPKRVPLTHGNIVATAGNLIRELGLGADDVCLDSMPMFHVGALVDLLVPPLAAGGAVICTPGFSVPAVEAALELKPTWFQVVPIMANELLEGLRGRPQVLRESELRYVRVVAAPLPPALQAEFEELFDLPLIEVYGMTETATLVATNPLPPGERRPGSVGRPAGPEVGILGADASWKSVGDEGEIVVRGPSVMPGYLGVDNDSTFHEDWFRTGDLGRFDEDGYLWLTGRSKNLINRGGEKIAPTEVDNALRSHPDVVDAAAFSVPHETLGEEVGAAVVLRAGAALDERELLEHVVQQVAWFKVPSVVRQVDELPRTASGKVRRGELDAADGRPLARSADASSSTDVGQSTGLTRMLAELWGDVLETTVAPGDHFFELGGDSLRALTLITQLQETAGEPILISALFDAPTLSEFEAYLRENHPVTVARLLGQLLSTERVVHERRLDRARLDEFQSTFAQLADYQPPTAPIPGRTVIMLGPPRSGSTLLRVLLAGNPELFAPPELYLLCFQDLAERRDWFTGSQRGHLEGNLRALVQLHGEDPDQARQRMEALERDGASVQEYFGLLQEWTGSRLLVDKTPFYGAFPETLARAEELFEEPVYIHLTRHPYGMIRSFEELRMHHLWYPRLLGDERAAEVPCPYDAAEMGEMVWWMVHENVTRFLESVPAERQHRLSYEELVSAPEERLREVCTFLGVDFHPDMLDPHGDPRLRMTDGLHRTSQMIGDVKFHRHRGINSAGADAWKSNYATDFLCDETWDLAERLGHGERLEGDDDREEFEL